MTISSRTDQAADLQRRTSIAIKRNTDRHVIADQLLAKDKLLKAKQKQASCQTCLYFKTVKYTTSCKLLGKQIKGYCICHLWEKKAQGK